MVNEGPKQLSDLIRQPGSALNRLAEEASRRSELADHLRSHLPGDLADQLVSCGVGNDGTLVVVASAPEWASRLRFESMNLLEAARGAGLTPARVRIRVNASAV